MAGFQTSVGVTPAPAVEGDWATANPRKGVLAGPGALVSGSAGLYIARWAWLSMSSIDPNGAPLIANNFGAGAPAGFVHREMQGLITTFLQEGSLWIPPGLAITLHNDCDVWVRNRGAAAAIIGMKAYADNLTGLTSFAATATPTTATGTGAIAAGTGSATGVINDNVLSLTGAPTGQFYPGATLSGTGVATGTKIVSQLTSTEAAGALGGRGTYSVSIPGQTVASTTISATFGVITMSGGTNPALGQVVSGSGVTTGTIVTALGGTFNSVSNAGKFIADPTQSASSTTLTFGTTSETPWYACSSGAVNDLIKVSRLPPFGG